MRAKLGSAAKARDVITSGTMFHVNQSRSAALRLDGYRQAKLPRHGAQEADLLPIGLDQGESGALSLERDRQRNRRKAAAAAKVEKRPVRRPSAAAKPAGCRQCAASKSRGNVSRETRFCTCCHFASSRA